MPFIAWLVPPSSFKATENWNLLVIHLNLCNALKNQY